MALQMYLDGRLKNPELVRCFTLRGEFDRNAPVQVERLCLPYPLLLLRNLDSPHLGALFRGIKLIELSAFALGDNPFVEEGLSIVLTVLRYKSLHRGVELQLGTFFIEYLRKFRGENEALTDEVLALKVKHDAVGLEASASRETIDILNTRIQVLSTEVKTLTADLIRETRKKESTASAFKELKLENARLKAGRSSSLSAKQSLAQEVRKLTGRLNEYKDIQRIFDEVSESVARLNEGIRAAPAAPVIAATPGEELEDLVLENAGLRKELHEVSSELAHLSRVNFVDKQSVAALLSAKDAEILRLKAVIGDAALRSGFFAPPSYSMPIYDAEGSGSVSRAPRPGAPGL